MQFAYQYPQRCERLVLVSSGGLGVEVSAHTPAAALPGADHLLALVAHRHVIAAGKTIGRLAATVGVRPTPGLLESGRGYATLAYGESRKSFVSTLRGIIDHRGQRVSGINHLHLMHDVPCLLIWGDRDRIIPVEHGRRAHRALPSSQLEIFEGSGHFPHADDPERFANTAGVHRVDHARHVAVRLGVSPTRVRSPLTSPRSRRADIRRYAHGEPSQATKPAPSAQYSRSRRNGLRAANPGLEAGTQDVHRSVNIPAKSLLL